MLINSTGMSKTVKITKTIVKRCAAFIMQLKDALSCNYMQNYFKKNCNCQFMFCIFGTIKTLILLTLKNFKICLG